MAQDLETRIKSAFDHILANYGHARCNPFAREEEVWPVFEELAAYFQDRVSRPTLKVKWSVGKGTSADTQLAVFEEAQGRNDDRAGALRAVTDWIAEATLQ